MSDSQLEDRSKSLHRGPNWWRFDAYEVVDGRWIAPAAGAELEWYDPLEAYEQYWEGKSRQGMLPYTELVDLNPNDDGAIIDWCTRHGLLGIAPHRTLEVNLWPRWEEAAGPPPEPMGGGLMGGRSIGRGIPGRVGSTEPGEVGEVPIQPRYVQAVGDATTKLRRAHRKSDRPEGEVERPLSPDERARLEREAEFGQGFRSTGVRALRVNGKRVDQLDLLLGYAQFFPRQDRVREWWPRHEERTDRGQGGRGEYATLAYRAPTDLEQELLRNRYPLPTDADFLREYAEPLALFHAYSQQLQWSLNYWRGSDGSSAPARNASAPDRILAGLHPLSPHPTRVQEAGTGWARVWDAPSLYAILHGMMLQDFAFRGSLVVRCEGCGGLFPTDRGDQNYCSKQCRWAEQKRRQRNE